MRFLHAADLHIDSPLLGLDRFEGAPVEQIRRAPREAFRRLIDLALTERVDFVILAGDIFDGAWRDVGTGLFFVTELERLASTQPIPVYVVLGNHDAESTITSRLSWPLHVRRFDAARPQTYLLEDLGVALHGQSFGKRAVPDDLAIGFPAARAGMVNIGILHTSLGGYAEHLTYAPTTLDVLRGKGYDAWCLGHVHERQIVCGEPLVLYPGNIQGRHIKERGARGCFIIDDESGVLRAEFHGLDTVRWELVPIEASAQASCEYLLAAAESSIATLAQEHDGRLLCLRVVFSGVTSADADLRERDATDDLRAELVRAARRVDAWIESVRVRTMPARSLTELRLAGGMIGEVFSGFEEAREKESPLRARLRDALRAMPLKLPKEVAGTYRLRFDTDESLDQAIDEAEAVLLERVAT